MKFYCIALAEQKTTIELLKAACKARSIPFVLVDPESFDPTNTPQKGDLLYRVSDVKHPGTLELEYQLISEGVSTFYQNNDIRLLNLEEVDSFLLQKAQLPVPKTFFYIPNERDVVAKVVESLGGLPIVVKVLGGSHGVGVIKADSLSSLYSVVDFVRSTGKRAVLKEYIDVTSSARLIVLGDRVVDSIEYQANENDFRSNEGRVPNVVKKTFDQSVNHTAIQAVKSLGLEFGGVDILLDKKGKIYITEVNFPCFFPRCQMLTGTDIAGMMIDYLIEKCKKN
jgi:ribosomal protein S6--L-glutamate ligase